MTTLHSTISDQARRGNVPPRRLRRVARESRRGSSASSAPRSGALADGLRERHGARPARRRRRRPRPTTAPRATRMATSSDSDDPTAPTPTPDPEPTPPTEPMTRPARPPRRRRPLIRRPRPIRRRRPTPTPTPTPDPDSDARAGPSPQPTRPSDDADERSSVRPRTVSTPTTAARALDAVRDLLDARRRAWRDAEPQYRGMRRRQYDDAQAEYDAALRRRPTGSTRPRRRGRRRRPPTSASALARFVLSPRRRGRSRHPLDVMVEARASSDLLPALSALEQAAAHLRRSRQPSPTRRGPTPNAPRHCARKADAAADSAAQRSRSTTSQQAIDRAQTAARRHRDVPTSPSPPWQAAQLSTIDVHRSSAAGLTVSLSGQRAGRRRCTATDHRRLRPARSVDQRQRHALRRRHRRPCGDLDRRGGSGHGQVDAGRTAASATSCASITATACRRPTRTS